MAGLLTGDSMNVAVEHSIGHFTHEKSPVGCAAGLAVLEVFRENDIAAHVRKLEKIAGDRLADMKNRYELIDDVRGLGLLWGIDLVTDRETKERACVEAEKIMYRCLDNGLSFKVAQGNVIVLAPPLIITESELEHAFDILEEAFSNLN